MKKIILSLLILFGFGFYLAKRAQGFSLEPYNGENIAGGGMQYNTLSSSGMAFLRAGIIYQVYASTGNPSLDWFQIFDTNTVAVGQPVPATQSYAAFTTNSTQTITPATLFYSTSTGAGPALNKSYDFSPYGVLATTGCFVYFGAGVPAQGRSVTIMYKK